MVDYFLFLYKIIFKINNENLSKEEALSLLEQSRNSCSKVSEEIYQSHIILINKQYESKDEISDSPVPETSEEEEEESSYSEEEEEEDPSDSSY